MGPSTNYVFHPGSQVQCENTNHIKSIKCKIQGIPRPQYRCFATTQGSKSGKPHLFSPSKDNQNSFKQAFNQALAAAPQGLFQKSLSNPVTVTVRFYFPHPKKHYIPDGKGCLVLSPNAPTVVTKTPDLDNCIKLVLDALEDICYLNDYNVVQINSSKVFDDSQTIWTEGQASKGWTIIKVCQINDSIYVPGCSCLCCERKLLRNPSL
jgi:Holliday junction resolvase RusA-like endonuclease